MLVLSCLPPALHCRTVGGVEGGDRSTGAVVVEAARGLGLFEERERQHAFTYLNQSIRRSVGRAHAARPALPAPGGHSQDSTCSRWERATTGAIAPQQQGPARQGRWGCRLAVAVGGGCVMAEGVSRPAWPRFVRQQAMKCPLRSRLRCVETRLEEEKQFSRHSLSIPIRSPPPTIALQHLGMRKRSAPQQRPGCRCRCPWLLPLRSSDVSIDRFIQTLSSSPPATADQIGSSPKARRLACRRRRRLIGTVSASRVRLLTGLGR